MKIGVIIEHKNNALDKLWSYKVPFFLQSKIKIGQRVKIVFNKQIIIAFIVKIEHVYNYEDELSDIIDIVEEESFINKRSLNLVKYLEFNFLNRKIDYLNLFLLKFVVDTKKIVYYPKDKEKLTSNEKIEYDKLGYVLNVTNLTNFTKDFITEEKRFRYDRFIKRCCSIRKFELFFDHYKNNKQLQALKFLLENGSEIKINSKILSHQNLNKLLDKNIVKLTQKYAFYDINLNLTQDVSLTNHLNYQQREIVSKIKLDKYHRYLLQGVTGSGKTHVFIELIKKVNQNKKMAYVLIPEVGLSYKIFEKISKYVNDSYLYHYKMPQSYKRNLYEKLQKKQVNLIVGTRSTLFLNNENIGIIIFDEEHDEDYYQHNTPSFDTKKLANVIAAFDKFPIIYASATPSMYAKKLEAEKKITRLSLNSSFNKFKNTYEIVEHKLGQNFISNILLNKISQNLNKNEQTILLFNKKAYAQYLMCNDCNYIEMCENCDTTLKVYVNENKLKCLNCGLSRNITSKCIKCNNINLSYKGVGIEQVYNELIQIFDEKLIVLIDGDILSHETKRKQIMQQIENNKVKIILGTQIIAKGFDFKNITLGGIIDANNSLNFPSVDASEKTFQLLNQFMGRIGRHKQGHIVLQTLNKNEPLWEKICQSQYDLFTTNELYKRKKINAVPFVNECYFKLQHLKKDVLFNQTQTLSQEFKLLNYQVSDIYVPWISKNGLIYYLEFKVIYKDYQEQQFKKDTLYLKSKYSKYKIIIGNNPASWR